MTTATMGPIVAFVIIASISGGAVGAPYLGKFIGKLSELHHGVSGEVYAVDGRTLYLKDFTYDGQGPAAYFYASTSRNANSAGFRLRDENGSGEVIKRYRKEGVTLTLPEGKTLNNIKIFYVWCEEFEVNFGDVKIPRSLDYPRPQKIEPLKGVHAISSDNIVIVDAQTLLIPNLSYDGEAPDAKFWVGRGPKPSPQGIRVPDENGKEVPLRRYDRKTVVLTLPGDLTVFDIGHFGIWCEAFTVDFGHVQIPPNLNVPPSLKMLGVSPQSKLNCEVLYDDLAFEARWAVAGDSIVLQLVAKLDDGEYMSFGISGDDSRSEMIGGDVVVAWVDRPSLKGFAEDYYLGAKSQCSGPTGSCPDGSLKEDGDNVRLLNAAMVNGYSIVTYQRPLKPSDEYDRQIHTNRSQAIIWAIGPLNQKDEVSFHSHYTKGDQFLDFGRPAKWNCPMPESEQPSMKTASQPRQTTTTAAPSRSRNSERRRGNTRKDAADNDRSASRPRQTERRGNTRRGTNSVRAVPTPAPVAKRDAWDIPPIKCYEPEDGVFYAQMGPTGGKMGYPAITGHVGWGISWYINGLLIPEINVVRGKAYTFVVEGGFDPEVPAKYHPFYITDDPVGGYEYKTPDERKKVRIFAGAVFGKDGTAKPTGTGRLCHWTQQGDKEADDFESFGAYQRTLELKCDQGEPGVIQWTPDEDTPDTVYYQCFTHRYLGWKINVHDSCDEQKAASEPEVSVVPAPDLEESPSIRIETRFQKKAPSSLL
ncbi:protein Skeletor, isoforms B/C isoform X2 [Tenebrio molitor]|uniref:protein Skeletor, isoforms B/C isoform X2 n=1 Tax=Tenebrio molitor TaxID=7067 RepID=UPI0036247FC2